MAELHRSVATLRISHEDLDPAEITRLLGHPPTHAQRKGESVPTPAGQTRIAKFGSWRLEATSREPHDLNGQIAELLSQLTPSLDIWRAIAEKYRMDLFCGLFMQASNEGVELWPESLQALGDRKIELGLDIYAP